jgi:hypothetical protein
MTDDILIRLRNIASLRGPMAGSVIPDACIDAANEIERLRAEVHRLRQVIGELTGDSAILEECNKFLQSEIKLYMENATEWRSLFSRITADNDISHTSEVVKIEADYRRLAEKVDKYE